MAEAVNEQMEPKIQCTNPLSKSSDRRQQLFKNTFCRFSYQCQFFVQNTQEIFDFGILNFTFAIT